MISMSSPVPVPCHHPSSSEVASSHVLKTEQDLMTQLPGGPFPYEQPYNHFCFDPNPQPEGINVTGLMRIMPFQRQYQQSPTFKPYLPHSSSPMSLSLPFAYDSTATPTMFQPLPIGAVTFGHPPQGLHGDSLLIPQEYSPNIPSESVSDNLSPLQAGPHATVGADCHGVSHTATGCREQQVYRGDRCEGVVCSMGTSPHTSSAGEEHVGVVRNAKRMRASSASSDQDGVLCEGDPDTQSYHGNGCQEGIFPSGSSSVGGMYGCQGVGTTSLKWQPHVTDTWTTLCDENLCDIPPVDFQVEADKGFVFSIGDDSYVCQKKNHFQISAHIVFHNVPKYVKMKDNGIQQIEKFQLVLHGIKFESLDSVIQLEQSLPDRSKVKFEPVLVEVPDDPEKPVRSTVCRLHFSETTANNMRKRGRPNPDQKHFCVVVCLSAQTAQGSHTVASHVSERIIVRASNPGHFDNDCDYMWLRSSNGSEAIHHHGKVGINTEKPEEALTVNGHIQLTGQLLQLSDMRLKRNITKADSALMLSNISKVQLYEYQLACDDPSPCAKKVGHFGCSQDTRREIGVLAQELTNVIPDAVQQTDTNMALQDGTMVPSVLVVSKERVFMETVGAVQELAKTVAVLERRIAELTAIQKTTTTHLEHPKLGAVPAVQYAVVGHTAHYLALCAAALFSVVWFLLLVCL